MSNETLTANGKLIWDVAEILRGPLKPADYQKVVLPFTVLRRLDCALEGTKDAVLAAAAGLPEDVDDGFRAMVLKEAAGPGMHAYNTSPLTFAKIRAQNPADVRANLLSYIAGFPADVQDVFATKFKFPEWLKTLDEADILWLVFQEFARADLHPQVVSNIEMGYLFEELIRKFSELSNETAGEHFTPREVVRLLVTLLLSGDRDALTKPGVIRQVYDPAIATGGMVAIAEAEMRKLNPRARVELFGQEINPESFAICRSDMLITGHDPDNIAFGNTLTQDAHRGKRFHYMISNPPYGVDWSKYQDPIKAEAKRGHAGRFGAGLPRTSDGQLLFVQHMISKMRDDENGSRIAVVMNGSPLFTGGARSGESEIRRWILENDWLEAIIALPTSLFYNTGIQTYVWMLSNRKAPERRGRVQLIDASGERFWRPMRRSLGDKRREIPDAARDEIARIYAEMEVSDVSKVFDVAEFGYREIRVEWPLKLRFDVTEEGLERLARAKAILKLEEGEAGALLGAIRGSLLGQTFMDRERFLVRLKAALKAEGIKAAAPVLKAVVAALGVRDPEAVECRDSKGNTEPDPDLRDHELVPLGEDWKDYFAREVKPFVPDAWVDTTYRDGTGTLQADGSRDGDGEIGRVGYEIPFNRHFHRYVPPRPLDEIGAEMRALEAEIAGLLREVVG